MDAVLIGWSVLMPIGGSTAVSVVSPTPPSRPGWAGDGNLDGTVGKGRMSRDRCATVGTVWIGVVETLGAIGRGDTNDVTAS
jgi:hypothetical protein